MKYRNRAIFYLLGVLTLSFGVTLCTKSELGIAANVLMGVGIGTVISMVFVGRVISVFNHHFKDRILKLAGLEKPEICQ